MNEILEVNGVYLDIDPGSISRQIRVSDIADITSRRSSYSAQFKLRKTVKNVKALDGVGVAGSSSALPYSELRVNYYIDSIPIVTNGYMSIEDDDENFYYVRIKDGLVVLSKKLDGYTLKDLPLSTLNHNLNAETVVNSFSKTDGYIYAIANFGKGYDQAEYLAPSVYISTIWDKIFEFIGVDYSGSFFETDPDFLNEVITPSIGIIRESSGLTEIFKGTATTATKSVYYTSQKSINRIEEMPLSGYTSIITAGDYKINAEINHSISKGEFTLLVKVNNVTKATYFIDGSGTTEIEIPLKLTGGDQISLFVRASDYSSDENSNYYTVNGSLSASLDFYYTTGGVLVDVSGLLDEISLKDFVGDIMNRYGLFINEIGNSGNVFEFKKIESILSDRSSSKDWTSKIVGTPKRSYLPDVAQRNVFSFTYPKDVAIQGNDGEIIVNNFNLEESDDLYTSPFEIPKIYGLFKGQKTYSIDLFSTNDNGEINTKTTPAKLMNITKVNDSITIRYFDELTEDFTGDIPFLSLDHINMAYFIAKNYTQYEILLNKYKEMSVGLNLSPIDIYNLRFDILYYFKQLGRYYYLNSVKYTPGRTATGNFVEVPEFAVNSSPETVGNYDFDLTFNGSRNISRDLITSQYYDREFDEPLKIKFLSGFNPDVKLFNGSIEISENDEVLISDLDLKIQDFGTGTESRSYHFGFTIADAGSGQYSSNTGFINVNISQYTPVTPIADAGPDKSFAIDASGNEANPYHFLINASLTTSADPIESYLWEVISSPANSFVDFSQQAESTSFIVAAGYFNIGVYTVKLTVTTIYGISSTDTLKITITQK